jgi:hypothetical protein
VDAEADRSNGFQPLKYQPSPRPLERVDFLAGAEINVIATY